MKKLMSGLLAVLLLFSAAACSHPNAPTPSAPVETTAPEQTPTPAPTPTPRPTPTLTPGPEMAYYPTTPAADIVASIQKDGHYYSRIVPASDWTQGKLDGFPRFNPDDYNQL